MQNASSAILAFLALALSTANLEARTRQEKRPSRALFGPTHTQDAFHLFVCEEQGLDGLVTLDVKLRRKFEHTGKKLNTAVRVLLPW